jgi:tetratricopeptide (TPR) repeat protein
MKGIFTGVAFFAHVGGFLFGLAVGFGIKVFKIEEKFLFSKIEKQIEAVELSPKLSIAFSMKDSGDIEGAVKLLKEVIAENPANDDPRLELARYLLLLEREKQAAGHYETILSRLYEKGKMEELFNIFLEVYEKKLDQFFSAKTLFRTGSYLVSIEEYKKGVELFSMIVKHYPTDRFAPTALLKMGRIFLNNLEDEPLGKGALEFLIKNYPDYSGTHEAQTLLMKYNN